MNDLLSLFSYPFVLKALAVGTIVSLCAALLGVILLVKRYSMIGHALADIGFAALSIALAVGVSPLYVSTPLLVVASFAIMALSQRKGVSGDVAIGVAASSALAIGLIVTALTKGFNIDVLSYMFGSVLSMTRADVEVTALLGVVVIGLYVLFYNRLFLVACDEEFAIASGINLARYQFVIACLTALTVAVGMRMMGTLLISSLIIFPAVTARKLAKGFREVTILAAIISVVCFITGIVFSFLVNIPTGASVVAANMICLLIASVIKGI